MGKITNRDEVNCVMAFFADPELEVDDFAHLTSQALYSLSILSRRHEVSLVDDGNTLKGSVNIKDIVYTIKTKTHTGKAGAIRAGLKKALENNPKTQYFIQSDFDGDPNPRQAWSLVRLLRQQGITGDHPTMILGERDEALRKNGFFDNHRKTVFALQTKFCQLLGYSQISDPTTGLRVYTRSLAEIFVKNGISQGFGSDVEQLILARLFKAQVLPVKLTSVRKRTDHTAISKFLACQETLKLYFEPLKEIGHRRLVDVFGNLNPSKELSINLNGQVYRLDPNGDFLRGKIG